MQTFSAHTIPQCRALNFTYSRCICVVSSCGFPHYPVTLRTNSPRQASFVHYLNINRRPSKNPTFMFPQVPRIPSRHFDTTLVRQKQCVENYKHQCVNQVWSIFQNSARSLGPTCSSETEGELPWPGEHTHSYRHRFNGSQLWMVAWYSKTTINVKGGRTCWPTKQREREHEREKCKDGGKVRDMKKKRKKVLRETDKIATERNNSSLDLV